MLLAISANSLALSAAAIGVLTLVATVAAPLLSARRERPRRGLAYEANVLPLTVDRPETPTRIKMSIGGPGLRPPTGYAPRA